jgi:hypothetical protein
MRLSVGSVRPLSIWLRVGALFTGLRRGPAQGRRVRITAPVGWQTGGCAPGWWFMASWVRGGR